jgi:MFS family permease
MSSSQFACTLGSFDPVQQRWSLTSNQQSLGTGLGYAGVILGLLCGSPLNERLGRKKCLWIQSFIVAVGVTIESIT